MAKDSLHAAGSNPTVLQLLFWRQLLVRRRDRFSLLVIFLQILVWFGSSASHLRADSAVLTVVTAPRSAELVPLVQPRTLERKTIALALADSAAADAELLAAVRDRYAAAVQRSSLRVELQTFASESRMLQQLASDSQLLYAVSIGHARGPERAVQLTLHSMRNLKESDFAEWVGCQLSRVDALEPAAAALSEPVCALQRAAEAGLFFHVAAARGAALQIRDGRAELLSGEERDAASRSVAVVLHFLPSPRVAWTTYPQKARVVPNLVVLAFMRLMYLTMGEVAAEMGNGVFQLFAANGVRARDYALAWVKMNVLLGALCAVPVLVIAKFFDMFPASSYALVYALFALYLSALLNLGTLLGCCASSSAVMGFVELTLSVVIQLGVFALTDIDELPLACSLLLFLFAPLGFANYMKTVISAFPFRPFTWRAVFWEQQNGYLLQLLALCFSNVLYVALSVLALSFRSGAVQGCGERSAQAVAANWLAKFWRPAQNYRALRRLSAHSISEVFEAREGLLAEKTMVSVVRVSKSFSQNGAPVPVLRSVSFAVQRGSVCCVLAHNGTGKTTLLSLLARTLQPDAGTVRIGGGAQSEPAVAYCPQEIEPPAFLRLIETLCLFARIKGMDVCQAYLKLQSPSAYEREIYYAESAGYFELPQSGALRWFNSWGLALCLMKQLGLLHCLFRYPRQVSVGELRRFYLALILIGEPEVVLLDEPTLGLDITGRRFVVELLRSYRNSNVTLIFSTQYVDEAEQLADQILFLQKGAVLLNGSPQQLQEELGLTYAVQLHFAPVSACSDESAARLAAQAAVAEKLKKCAGKSALVKHLNAQVVQLLVPSREAETLLRVVRACEQLQDEQSIECFAIYHDSLNEVFFRCADACAAEEAEHGAKCAKSISTKTLVAEDAVCVAEASVRPQPLARQVMHMLRLRAYQVLDNKLKFVLQRVAPLVVFLLMYRVMGSRNEDFSLLFGGELNNRNAYEAGEGAAPATVAFAKNALSVAEEVRIERFLALAPAGLRFVPYEDVLAKLDGVTSSDGATFAQFLVALERQPVRTYLTRKQAQRLDGALVFGSQPLGESESQLTVDFYSDGASSAVAATVLDTLLRDADSALRLRVQSLKLRSLTDVSKTSALLYATFSYALSSSPNSFGSAVLAERLSGYQLKLLQTGLSRKAYWVGTAMFHGGVALCESAVLVGVLIRSVRLFASALSAFATMLGLLSMIAAALTLFAYACASWCNSSLAYQFVTQFVTTVCSSAILLLMQRVQLLQGVMSAAARWITARNVHVVGALLSTQYLPIALFIALAAAVADAQQVKRVMRVRELMRQQYFVKLLAAISVAHSALYLALTVLAESRVHASGFPAKLRRVAKRLAEQCERQPVADEALRAEAERCAAFAAAAPAQLAPAQRAVRLLAHQVYFAYGLTADRKLNFALRHVFFQCCAGEIVVLLGENGAGKSTLVRLIQRARGFERPLAGALYLAERRLSPREPVSLDLAVMAQENDTWHDLRVLHILDLVVRVAGCPGGESLCGELVFRLGLQEHLGKKFRQLSGGVKRKVCLACNLLRPGRVLVLDEPFAGLDPSVRQQVRALLLAERRTRTILITTHNTFEAELLADKLVILSRGKVRFVDAPHALQKQFAEKYAVALFGQSVPAHLARLEAELAAMGMLSARELRGPAEVRLRVDMAGARPSALLALLLREQEAGAVEKFTMHSFSLESLLTEFLIKRK